MQNDKKAYLRLQEIMEMERIFKIFYKASCSPGQAYDLWHSQFMDKIHKRSMQVWEAASYRTDNLNPQTDEDHHRIWADACRRVGIAL
jgi:hypothetical protein